MRQQEQNTTKYKLSGGKNVALIINSKSCSAEWPYWPPEAFLSLQHHPLYSIVSSRHHHIGMSYTYILDTYNLIWGKVGSHFHVALALLRTYHFWAHFSFQVQCQKTTQKGTWITKAMAECSYLIQEWPKECIWGTKWFERVLLNNQVYLAWSKMNWCQLSNYVLMHDLKGNNSSSLMPYSLTLRHLLWIEVKSIW